MPGACEAVLYRFLDQLKFFNFFLDKILAYTQSPQVLDDIYSANDPEIRALLRAFAISMLRTKPPAGWIKALFPAARWLVRAKDGRKRGGCRVTQVTCGEKLVKNLRWKTIHEALLRMSPRHLKSVI